MSASPGEVGPFPHLMEPINVGSLELPNRVVMGSMHTHLEELDRPAERVARFLARRAEGGAGLIVTSGFSPNLAGRTRLASEVLDRNTDLRGLTHVARAVHEAGGRIALQLLHRGRYSKHEGLVGPSDQRARINPRSPRRLTTDEVWRTIDDFAMAASLAREAGYDGVEIMAGEGYLINQFLSPVVNDRDDEFGGGFENRSRLAAEIIRAVRARTGADFAIMWRISAADLVEEGQTGDEVVAMAQLAQSAGADCLNTGIGWHESKIPTIAASVPPGAWAFASRRVKDAVTIPVIGAIRLNTPELAEAFLAEGNADMVALARPFLADPDFVVKARSGRSAEINNCIACNQSCLDHIFTDKVASCLVNPLAGRETDLVLEPARARKTIAVVGGGPAGLSFAINAAERGHRVTLFEAREEVGGQINYARQVPGKTEFDKLLRYFRVHLDRLAVEVRLSTRATSELLEPFDEVVIASGVRPRVPPIEGVDHPSVVTYDAVLSGRAQVGARVAIIGAGGIGFDVAEFLVGDHRESLDPEAFFEAWGVDTEQAGAGGLKPPAEHLPRVSVTMLQRKPDRLGSTLGKSTGWILKERMRRAGVAMVPGAAYERIDDAGLHIVTDGVQQVLPVDTVILCTGQESVTSLYDDLVSLGRHPHLIGGAHVAAEIDAARAIREATTLALSI